MNDLFNDVTIYGPINNDNKIRIREQPINYSEMKRYSKVKYPESAT